jgi:hypothetical protein
VDVRIVLACALLCALAAGTVAAVGERDYRARSFVIRVPPGYTGERGLELARSEAVLGRALVLASEEGRDAGWLRERSRAELTSRLDLAFTVETDDRERSAALATAYAKAFRSEIPTTPGLATQGRGARDAQPELGPLGWALLGGAAGLWLGAALAILQRARSARAERRLGRPDRGATRPA